MKKIFSILALAAMVLLCANCSMTRKIEGNAVPVNYTVLRNYYVNNTVTLSKRLTRSFNSEAEFNQFFGAAASMGADGEPTQIDWNKQYVLAVLLPETDRLTTMTPVSVTRNGNSLIFTYAVSKGAKQTYTMAPYCAVVLDRDKDAEQLTIYYNQQ